MPWTHVVNDINGEEVAGRFWKKNCKKKKKIQKEFRIEHVPKRKKLVNYILN